MSNELIVAAAVVGGIALGMNRKVQGVVTKSGSMLEGAWNAAGEAFNTPTETTEPVRVAKR